MSALSSPPTDPMTALQAAVQEAQAGWPGPIRLSIAEQPNAIADRLPLLLAGAFPTLPEEQLHTVTVAGHLLANSIIVFDDVIDGEHETDPIVDPLRGQAIQFEAYHLLHGLFPAESDFWPALRATFTEYCDACLAEAAAMRGKRAWAEFGEDDLIDIIRRKSGLAKVAATALGILSDARTTIAPVQASIENVYIAVQMLDDLSDWRGDLERRCPSPLLRRVLDAPTPPPDTDSDSWMHHIERRVYYEGHAQATMRRGLQALEEARAAVDGYEMPRWRRTIDGLGTKLAALEHDLANIVARNITHAQQQPNVTVEQPETESPWQRLAWSGLKHLVAQWKRGFPEARHMMRFRHDEGFTAPTEVVDGDVFARALIAEALAEATPRTRALDTLLQYEVDHLIRNQDPETGGWSYFPTLPELPPDADDLGQVIRAMLLAGRREEALALAHNPLQILFRDHTHPHGGFETWIVPKAPTTPLQKRQKEFVHRAWGTGCDPDVIANLAYTLTLTGLPEHWTRADAAASFLETHQRPDGTWRTPWYHSPYYGLYIGMRALRTLRPGSPALARSVAYIQNERRTDGSWGLPNEAGDPLNTALALLALAHAGALPSPSLLQQSRAFLEATRSPDGSWADTPLIRMNLGRAQDRLGLILSYGSRTVTTAFVSRAAFAIERSRAGRPLVDIPPRPATA